jgi:hypothetical protein
MSSKISDIYYIVTGLDRLDKLMNDVQHLLVFTLVF